MTDVLPWLLTGYFFCLVLGRPVGLAITLALLTLCATGVLPCL